MNKEWQVLREGYKPGEKIVGKLSSDGKIEKVASAYLSRHGWTYNLYPVNFGTYSTINKKMSVSVFKVETRI